jgi:hypothetical protein
MKHRHGQVGNPRAGVALGAPRLTVLVIVVALALAGGCKDNKKAGETPAQATARQLREKLLLPKDAKYQKAEVMLKDDRIVFHYGTDLSSPELKKFFSEGSKGKVVLMGKDKDNGIGFRGEGDLIVNYAWFPRDADIYKFKTALDVAITPLPKEIKKDQKIE